jgi:hypothetical protein
MSDWKQANEAQGAQGQDAYGDPMPGAGQGAGFPVYNQQSGQYAQDVRQSGPAPGGFYQFQPGVGFIQVQGAPGQGQFMSGQGQFMPGQGASDPSMGAAYGQGAGQGASAGIPGTPPGAEPKFDQHRMGEVYGMVNDVMNGEAEPAKLLGFLSSAGGDFWKGALVGAAAVFLLNNDAVKGAVAGAFGSVFGGQQDEDQE